jgi:hypothetical protein
MIVELKPPQTQCLSTKFVPCFYRRELIGNFIRYLIADDRRFKGGLIFH